MNTLSLANYVIDHGATMAQSTLRMAKVRLMNEAETYPDFIAFVNDNMPRLLHIAEDEFVKINKAIAICDEHLLIHNATR